MEFWNEIWVTLMRNRWRTLMTVFGVFWGIWMLITLSGVGQGIGNNMMPDAGKTPTNSLFFFPRLTTLPYHGFQSGRYWSFTNDDIDALEQYLGDDCDFVVGLGFNWDSSVSFEGRQAEGFDLRGVMPEYIRTIQVELMYGRFVNNIDLAEKRNVCVIGEQLYMSLFANGIDPCGSNIKIGSRYYKLVGVLRKTGDFNFAVNPQNAVFLPLTTMQFNYHEGNKVSSLIVGLRDDCPADQYEQKIGTFLKQRHQVSPDDHGALDMASIAQFVASFQSLMTGINVLLWIVGLGMLLSGLIGIGNIMLVTVKERTQEIGIRRAIGAKPWRILFEILMESLVITAASGVAGLVAGVGTLSLLDTLSQSAAEPVMKNVQISFALAVGALVILVIGGLAAGLIPALRAMRIKVIESLAEK